MVHERTLPSLNDEVNKVVGPTSARVSIPPAWPMCAAPGSGVPRVFHNLHERSDEPDTSVRPWSANARAVTRSLCPLSEASGVPPARSYRSIRSPIAKASVALSGETAMGTGVAVPEASGGNARQRDSSAPVATSSVTRSG